MKRTLVSSLVCALALSLCFSAASRADDPVPQPDPHSIFITDILYNGSGCPPDSAVIDLAPDGQAFTVIYSEFIAESGPGISLARARKNCQLNLTVHVPQGFTYAIAAVDYRGYANLAAGASGLQKATYYFQGQEPQASTWRGFTGAFDDDWHFRDEVEYAALVWAPCGEQRSLNINSQLRIDKGSASSSSSSIMAMDSEDGSIRQIYHFHWRTCDQP